MAGMSPAGHAVSLFRLPGMAFAFCLALTPQQGAVMPRIVWKGAISFGLVHVPVVVYPGARAGRLDFGWLDKRDMAPVGYQRINKRTGKPVDNDFVVKGYQYEKGEYVLMSDEDFRRANDFASQTVEILAFVDVSEVPVYYYETPYYLEPDRRGEKGYRLLREVLRKSGRVGIASVVLHTRQHLAALLPLGDALVLNTMRYADEIVSMDELKLPEGKMGKDGPTAREYEMAQRLVDDMTQEWRPEEFRNTYREDLLARIDVKIQAGQTHQLTEPDGEAPKRESAKVIDLMSLLKQSIDRRGASGHGARETPPRGGPSGSRRPAGDGASGSKPPAKTATGRPVASKTYGNKATGRKTGASTGKASAASGRSAVRKAASPTSRRRAA
jgi:DNA end-binding protein Ku